MGAFLSICREAQTGLEIEGNICNENMGRKSGGNVAKWSSSTDQLKEYP